MGSRDFLFSISIQTGHLIHTTSSTLGIGIASRGWSSRGVTFITHRHLAPMLWMGSTIVYSTSVLSRRVTWWNVFYFSEQHESVWTDMTRRNVKCVTSLNLIRDVFSFNRGCATGYDRFTWFYWVIPYDYGGKLTRFGQRRFPSTSLPVNSLFRNNHIMSYSSIWYELIALLTKPYIKQHGGFSCSNDQSRPNALPGALPALPYVARS